MKCFLSAALLFVATLCTTVAQADPTRVVTTTWVETVTGPNSSTNGNVWVNVWPSDRNIGLYGYVQGANPEYAQCYGGLAYQGLGGALECGVGLGGEHIPSEYHLRKSAYGIIVVGRYATYNWYEQSRAGGWWMLSQTFYTVKSDRFEAGFRLQRYLGGGPMVRLTYPIRRVKVQPSLATPFDGDRLNPILGLSASF